MDRHSDKIPGLLPIPSQSLLPWAPKWMLQISINATWIFTLILTSMLVCSRVCILKKKIWKKNAHVICIAGEQKAEKGCKVASKQIIILLFLLPNTPKLCWLNFFFSIWGFRMGFKLSPTRNHDKLSHLIFFHFIEIENLYSF